jgi:hypothetical protein
MADIFASLSAMSIDSSVQLPKKQPYTLPPPNAASTDADLVRRVGGTPSTSSCYDHRFDADKAFLLQHAFGWTSSRLFDSNILEWVAFRFQRPVTVTSIAFKGDADLDPLDSPTSYCFQGSSDGEAWVTLLTEEDTPPYVSPAEVRHHVVAKPGEFLVYRLLVTQTSWSKPGNLCGSVVVRDFLMF